MAQIIATMKVFPKDIVISPNELKKGIKTILPEDASIYKIEEEPIAFGLIALVLHIIMPDSGGKIDKVEEAIRKVKGISEVETLLIRRI